MPGTRTAAHGPASGTGTGELMRLAGQIPTLVDRSQVMDSLLSSALAVSGAHRAAILERTALDGLRRVHEHRSGLPEAMVIGDVRATLWTVLLGRAHLVWHGADGAPIPFRGLDGWEHGVVVRITSRRGPTKLLALGGAPVSDRSVIQVLQALADIAAPSIESLELMAATRKSHALLRGVTDLAGNLGAAVSPAQLLHAMVQGLCNLDGIAGALVWAADEPAADTTQVVAAAPVRPLALPQVVRARVQRLLNPGTGTAVRALVENAARPDPDGPLLTLMTLPMAPPRVLGILHDAPLDDLSRGVLASLAIASGPAMREVQMAAERRSLLSSYTRALRPSTRPRGMDLAIQHHPNTSAPGSFGGDFYDWFEVADDHAVIALGDVSGKGISAASAANMVVWSLRAVGGRGAQPTVISHLLNSIVAQELDVDRFVTLALLTVDQATWQTRMLLAGHPAPLLVHHDAVSIVVSVPAPPLGVSAVNSAAPPTTLQMDVGDALVLFTDGVTDAQDAEGRRYGVERLRSRAARLVGHRNWTAEGLAASLWDSVHAWAGGPPDDDCAILVVRRPV